MDTLNWVDYIFISILVISILIGMGRGLIKEVISIVTWIAAFIVACTFSTRLAASFSGATGVVESTVSSSVGVNADSAVSMLAVGACFVALFIGTLIIGSIISYIVGRAAKIPGVSFFNRMLGGLFGAGRGLLFNLLIIFLVQLTAFAQEQAWSQSVIVKAYQPMAVWLNSKLEPGFENLKAKVGETLEGVGQQVLENKVDK
jgi:membrane protein required for colicin V production